MKLVAFFLVADADKLDTAFEYTKDTTQHGGLLVVRHGYLVYEKYFGRGDREAVPELASCGKAFTSIAVGIGLQEKGASIPDGLNQKVSTPKYQLINKWYVAQFAYPARRTARCQGRRGQRAG